MRAQVVICAPLKFPSYFTDDQTGTCALCEQAVRFRPHIPTRRVLVCLQCYIVHADPGAPVIMLGEAVEELREQGIDFG